ncbi:MAG: cytochrome c3 family protein [Phycisphaerae bacterium]
MGRFFLTAAILAAATGGWFVADREVRAGADPRDDAHVAEPRDPARDARAVDFPGGFAGGLVGSKHDFTDGGRVPGDLCTPCHTPHITAAQAPLLVQRPTATQPVRSYQSAFGELDASSVLCLSCHDGTAAPDVFTGPHAMNGSDRSSGGARPGRARLTSHPVGVAYPTNNPTYHSPESVARDGRIKLPAGRVQCRSCHDPHNTERHAGMLVKSNERSRLCLACHRL